MSTVRGVDLSSNNGASIDFKRVKVSGVSFALIKVTEGTTYVNPQAARHAREAKAAGLIVGAYAFVSPKTGRTGREEADFFVEHAKQCGLLDKGCLRPAADIEVTYLPKGRPSRSYHYRFVERLSHNLGQGTFAVADARPFIYTGSWFWDGVLGARNSHNCPLWLASYTTAWHKLVPQAFKKGVSIHQDTDQWAVPGVQGHVDRDIYLGKDVAMLHRHHCLRRHV